MRIIQGRKRSFQTGRKRLLPNRRRHTDQESGWLYYGYRYYAPKLGRWVSRDPIGEMGGASLNAFIGNSPPNRVDWLGLAATVFLHSTVAVEEKDWQAKAGKLNALADSVAKLAQEAAKNPNYKFFWDGAEVDSAEFIRRVQREKVRIHRTPSESPESDATHVDRVLKEDKPESWDRALYLHHGYTQLGVMTLVPFSGTAYEETVVRKYLGVIPFAGKYIRVSCYQDGKEERSVDLIPPLNWEPDQGLAPFIDRAKCILRFGPIKFRVETRTPRKAR